MGYRMRACIVSCLTALQLLACLPVSAAERFDLRDQVVRDRTSGLVWTRSANLPGKDLPLTEAREFIRKLNRQKHGGFADWRLPTREEILTLVEYGRANGYGKDDPALHGNTIAAFLNKQGFSGVELGSYWTSGKAGQKNFESWVVFMEDGRDYQGPQAGSNFVWPVRSGRK